MKKLPIGIQTFEKIIKENHCYVDKTEIIHNAAEPQPNPNLTVGKGGLSL